MGVFGENRGYFYLEITDWHELLLSKQHSSQRESSFETLLLLEQLVFFQEIHVFLPLS
jgi:hypothetical protein